MKKNQMKNHIASTALLFMFLISCNVSNKDHANRNIKKTSEGFTKENVTFQSEGVILAGSIFQAKNPQAAVVIVHGSDQVGRETEFAERLAKNNISVFTYDKRGVGESGGTYAGPEVGTNNIDTANLILLAKDASAAVDLFQKHTKDIPIGLVGFSQAGWIIPIAAVENPAVEFMVLFSGPIITTLEQLRFQFYTNGRTDFWENHTEADAREHTFNDPDKYQFVATDPKISLNQLSIPGLWVFGERDIQIPVKICIEQLDKLIQKGKPYEYSLFPSLGHNTANADNTAAADNAFQWIKQKAIGIINEHKEE